MKKLIIIVFGMLFTLAFSIPASANLITNGSFEQPIVTAHSGDWEVFTSPIDGWAQDGGIELQTSSLFGPAAEGNQYAELDVYSGGGNPWLVQTFDTIVGQSYTLSFAFSPRQGVADNNLFAGVISYLGGGHYLATGGYSASGIGLSGTDWTYYSIGFVADHTSSTIGFVDTGTDDGVGTFIDDVSVSAVPEPATVMLLGFGLVGLAGFGRKKFKK
jgi:hypothetical protein